MSEKLSMKDLSVKGKRLLMRVDFNVPQDEEGKISDDSRIRAVLPSIRYALDEGARLILMSHLGRPKGKWIEKYSLQPCAERLSQLLGKPVVMAKDCVGEEVQSLAKQLSDGEVMLLENLRFYEGEEHPEKEEDFVEQLAALGEVYVNDAFGTAHRAHASTVAITKFFPENSAAGFLLEKEIAFLGEHLLRPEHPFYAFVGGAKVSSKLGVLRALIEKVDGLFIMGGMAFTFLKAQGVEIGDSLCEDELLSTAKELLLACEEKGVRLLLPCDSVVADKISANATSKVVVTAEGIPANWMGMDIGENSLEDCKKLVSEAKTLLWNGPAGVFEFNKFSKGTLQLAEIFAASEATTIVGGGDSVAAVKLSGLEKEFSHLSTGGGAALEYVEFGKLPGIEALTSSTEKVKQQLR